jgi:hypothetical protein
VELLLTIAGRTSILLSEMMGIITDYIDYLADCYADR